MSKPLPRRADLRLIVQLVPPGGRVLDVGCGDGTLLQTLETEKQVDGHGIEIRNHRVEACMRKGLSVIQGDADTDLPDFPDRSFDYIILSQALQNMHRPREVLDQLLRIGQRAIVSFPNLGHWRARLTLLCRGRMPIVETSDTPRTWYDTPNIHLCTIRDFLLMCETSRDHRRGRARRWPRRLAPAARESCRLGHAMDAPGRLRADSSLTVR